MPGPRGEKRPADVIEAAIMVRRIATGEKNALALLPCPDQVRIGHSGRASVYYDGYFAPSPICEITKVEDISDGWMVEDACGDSFDLNVQGDTATVILADGHAYTLSRCE